MKTFEVTEYGIYENKYVVIDRETNKEYTTLGHIILPKEIFIEAFEKYIFPRLDVVDCSTTKRSNPMLIWKKLKESEKQ